MAPAPDPAIECAHHLHQLPGIGIQFMRRVMLQRPALARAEPLDQLRRYPTGLLTGTGAQVPVLPTWLALVATITLEGDANGAPHPPAEAYAQRFTGKYEYRLISGGIGHNPPQEAPQAFTQAVVDADHL